MEIRRLTRDDVSAFRELRLQGLRDHPEAFGESASEFESETLDDLADRYLRPEDDGATFALGAFDQGLLIGIVCLQRDRRLKRRHKAVLWGMIVAAPYRRRRVGKALVERLVEIATSESDLDHIMLTVATVNERARRLYESCGFASIGIEPKALRIDGVDFDQEHMLLVITRQNGS